MINKVFIFSIERATDRQAACKAQLLERSFPETMIEVWNGVDNIDFKTTSSLLQHAITEKGYTSLKESLKIGLQDVAPIAWVAQSIAFLDLFTHIHKNQHTAMILFDDHTVTRDFTTIQNILKTEIPFNFYGVFMPQRPWFEDMHLIQNLRDKNTWEMRPKENRVTMNGIQVPSESGMIISPTGAQFFRHLLTMGLTTKENEALWNTSFVLTLNHKLEYLNFNYQKRCFSFVYPHLHAIRYDNEMPCLMEIEDGTLRRPVSETKLL